MTDAAPVQYLFAIVVSLISLVTVLQLLILQNIKYQQYRLLQENLEQRLLTNTLDTEDAMLAQLSQELHNNIGQRLSTAHFLLQCYIEDNSTPPTLLCNANELLETGIIYIRNLSHSLNKDFLEENGLEFSLQKELEYIEQSGKIKCSLKYAPTHQVFDKNILRSIFCMVQELLQNVLRHAEATKLALHIISSENEYNITVWDNGKGFDTQYLLNLSHAQGLTSIKKRTHLFGGRLSISSQPGTGTTITIILPMPIPYHVANGPNTT